MRPSSLHALLNTRLLMLLPASPQCGKYTTGAPGPRSIKHVIDGTRGTMQAFLPARRRARPRDARPCRRPGSAAGPARLPHSRKRIRWGNTQGAHSAAFQFFTALSSSISANSSRAAQGCTYNRAAAVARGARRAQAPDRRAARAPPPTQRSGYTAGPGLGAVSLDQQQGVAAPVHVRPAGYRRRTAGTG